MCCLTRKNECGLLKYIKKMETSLQPTIKNARRIRQTLLKNGLMSSDITVDQVLMLIEKIYKDENYDEIPGKN